MSRQELFDSWWSREGIFLDPDTEDVSWYDKRRGLAEFAFNAAMNISGNYVADRAEAPQKVAFENGRTVAVSKNGSWLVVDRITP